MPSRPKWLQKKLFKNICFGAINLCKNYKTISLQSKFLRMFSRKQGQTNGSNTTKKMLWWNYFAKKKQRLLQKKCSKEFFCNTFDQDGNQGWAKRKFSSLNVVQVVWHFQTGQHWRHRQHRLIIRQLWLKSAKNRRAIVLWKCPYLHRWDTAMCPCLEKLHYLTFVFVSSVHRLQSGCTL